MKNGYLEITDQGATVGMKRKEPAPQHRLTAECPRCKGYGGWHLLLNAYGAGKHFDNFCSNCMGWGWVEPENAGHLHVFDITDLAQGNALRASKGLPPARFTYGRCCHNSICSICGEYRFIDSSD